MKSLFCNVMALLVIFAPKYSFAQTSDEYPGYSGDCAVDTGGIKEVAKMDKLIKYLTVILISLAISAGLVTTEVQIATAIEITYEKIHFTDDGTSDGNPLFPGFELNSVWWALGNDQQGNIYVAVSNHDTRPGMGNVAVFTYDPVSGKMTFIEDLKSASERFGNWLPGESQRKVHTELIENYDGKIYFATHDITTNDPGDLTKHRGTHIYYIEDGEIFDLSDFTSEYLDVDMNTVVGNIGVHVENYGTISMELGDGSPNLLYGVTIGDGYLYVLDLDSGNIKMIAKTGAGYLRGIIRHFVVDGDGNAYVPVPSPTNSRIIEIYKYDYALDTWSDTGLGYTDYGLEVDDPISGWLMQAYTKARDMIY